MWECKKCGEYRFGSVKECDCKPFTVIDEDGDKKDVIYAMDAEDAALKYAEASNCDEDYYLMNSSVEITVNNKKFRISAEPDVCYSADEL